VFQAESISWKVMAGPEEVAQRQGFSFAIGDSLTILGVPVTGPEGQMFLARQITRDGTTLTLLDAQGRPAGPGPRS
jgi:hypothetical protein